MANDASSTAWMRGAILLFDAARARDRQLLRAFRPTWRLGQRFVLMVRRAHRERSSAIHSGSDGSNLLRPIRCRDRQRSVPRLETASGRRAALLQREVRVLRAE